MGNCGGSGKTEEDKKNAQVDAENQQSMRQEKEKVKLLLLGAGESGKSTIFKQMKIMYGVMSAEETNKMTNVVYFNTIEGMKAIVAQLNAWGLAQTVSAKDALATVSNCPITAPIDMALGAALKALWEDPAIRAVWDRRAEFQVVDSVHYFFEKLSSIMQPEYQADVSDVLHTRVRTSGVVTQRYVIDGATFEMYDVGGQRNERKKWIHCFDDVNAVIFVAALSEFNQKLFEDATKNRMEEALQLFAEQCKSPYFKDSSMILFLNKKDLFEEKIKTIDISSVTEFSDCTAPHGDVEASTRYFIDKFLKQNPPTADRELYIHCTNATDTENVNRVFTACKDIILRQHMRDSGF